LFLGNINPANIPGRNTAVYSQLQQPNPFYSSEPSANSMYDNPNSKYYLFVTITAIGCSSYGTNGTKTYVWDGGADMNVQVPKNKQFTISIDFHEKCGAFWNTGNIYQRAMWVHQQTYSYQSVISISNWMFNRKSNC